MWKRRMQFSLEALKGAEVQQASLKVFAEGGSRIKLRVIKSRRTISKRVPVSRYPVWTDINLTDAVRLGLAEGSDVLQLEVGCGKCFRDSFVTEPKLNAITRQKRDVNARTKRSLRTDCYKDNHRKRCCRHAMDVVFKDLPGFEFIVQPYGFDAGYCKGRCPARYNPAHHHALLQSLVWKQDRQRAPRPCCAPSKLADLEILHLDQDDPTVLKVSTWKNMRVLECACS